MWMTRRELIHVRNVVGICAQHFDAHPTEGEDQQPENQVMRVLHAYQPVKQSAAGNKQKRINRQEVPYAYVDAARHRQGSVNCDWPKQPKETPVSSSEEHP